MLSLIVSLLYFGWQYFISKAALTTAYLSAAHLLFVLYILVTVFWLVLALVIGVIAVIGLKDNIGWLGALIGTGFTGLIFGLLMLQQALFICGAYLLSTAYNEGWDYVRLGFGALLLIVGLISNRKPVSAKEKK